MGVANQPNHPQDKPVGFDLPGRSSYSQSGTIPGGRGDRGEGAGSSGAYKYDSSYRVEQFGRGTLNSSLTDVTTPTTTPGLLQAQAWTLEA